MVKYLTLLRPAQCLRLGDRIGLSDGATPALITGVFLCSKATGPLSVALSVIAIGVDGKPKPCKLGPFQPNDLLNVVIELDNSQRLSDIYNS